MDLGPGDICECVDAINSFNGQPCERLTLGALYTIEAVGVVPAGYHYAGHPWVRIVGHKPGFGNFGYHARRFRPVSRRADFEAVLTSLKQPSPTLSPLPETVG